MREIKFRAWDKKNEKMLSEPTLSVGGNLDDIIGTPMSFTMIIRAFELHLILMQYTGLKDKNGKEIYEGDIIKTENHIVKVEWLENHARWTGHEVGKQYPGFALYQYKNCKIIGNIYENPELLS